MRNAIIGIVIGVVSGVVIGATIIAPRLVQPMAESASKTTAEIISIPPPAVVRWKMASAYAVLLPQSGSLAKRLEKEIWRVSDGAMEIRFHAPDALVSKADMFDAVVSGTIDAAFSSPGLWGDKIPALNLFSASPFGPEINEYLAWFYFAGGIKLFDDIYHNQGIHSVPCGIVSSEASAWFRREIKTLEDLKGVRMSVSGLGARVMAKIGVKTNSLQGGDILNAFEKGVIDAAEFSQPAINPRLGLEKMARHYYLPGWRQPAMLLDLMINLGKWQALSAIRQNQINAVCGDNIRFALAEDGTIKLPAIKELISAGVNVHSWPGEIIDAMDNAWQKVAADEARKDVTFRRVWKSLTAFRKDYAIWNELSGP